MGIMARGDAPMVISKIVVDIVALVLV